MRAYLLSIFFFVYAFLSASQTISGRITSLDGNEPVKYANIFLSGSLIGTTSDLDGKYSLKLNSKGKFQLVVSCVGYEDFIEEIEFDGNELILDIALKPDIKELKEIAVNPDTSNWKRNFDSFRDLFLGRTMNALKTEIKNPRDVFVFYDHVENGLYAHSKKQLTIKNEALGYTIHYLLKEFQMDYNTGQFKSFGIPRFEESKTTSKRLNRKWSRERKRAYQGSFQHFLNGLQKNSFAEEGFIVQELFKVKNRKRPPQTLIDQKLDVFKASMFAGNGFVIGSNAVEAEEVELTKDNIDEWQKKRPIPKTIDSLIRAKIEENGSHKIKVSKPASGTSNTNKDSLRYWVRKNALPVLVDSIGQEFKSKESLINEENHFYYLGNLKIIYTKESEEITYATASGRTQPEKRQESEIRILSPFKIYENAYHDVKAILFYGYWGWSQRIAEMLPLEYKPEY